MNEIIRKIMNITAQAFVLLVMISCVVSAQSVIPTADNAVYIDSIKAGPGQEVTINFNIKNSDPLNALSIPIKYDPEVLTIIDISFAGSRAEYLASKLLTPLDVSTINGHFQVGFVRIFEDPIPAGSGMIFTATFIVTDTATGRFVTELDTLFYPPGGELIFAQADFSSTVIYPEFVIGQVYVDASNIAPAFADLGPQIISEGDSLVFSVTSADPNLDLVSLQCIQKPDSALFIDNGDGTGKFVWTPPFLGDESSAGPPVTVIFVASDGDLTDTVLTEITVVNTNRKPIISIDNIVSLPAGDSLIIDAFATEPDLENLTWSYSGFPFEMTTNNNQAQFIWGTSVVDTGKFTLTAIATDELGLSDTSKTFVTITPVDIYTLAFDTVSAFPGGYISIALNLENRLPIGAFSLLVEYDPFALDFIGVENSGTRAASFEIFTFTNGADGKAGRLRIGGALNSSDPSITLDTGKGILAKLQFNILNQSTLGGTNSILTFISDSTNGFNDNSFLDSTGALIAPAEVVNQSGYVEIMSLADIKLGDINLNGIAYEIGDAIYYVNFFMDPVKFSFNPTQLANSDVNEDNIDASVADLIALINIMLKGGQPGKVVVGSGNTNIATIDISKEANKSIFSYETNFEVGGLFMTFEFKGKDFSYDLSNPNSELELLSAEDNDVVRVLLFSYEGKYLPIGSRDFLELTTMDDYQLVSIELATSSGELVKAEINDSKSAMPLTFALNQNYPNPFNPETNISFNLTKEDLIELVIFNVLGQEVKILIDEQYPSGTHTINWDGTDNKNSKVASGIYFYRLTTSSESMTRKMMLLK